MGCRSWSACWGWDELLHPGSTQAKATGRTQPPPPPTPPTPLQFQMSTRQPSCCLDCLQLQTFKATLHIYSMATEPVPLCP